MANNTDRARKATLIRAKDNPEDFSFTPKTLREEAEHNMGYFMTELNHRNQELEDELEQVRRELAQERFLSSMKIQDEYQRYQSEALARELAEKKRYFWRNIALALGVALLMIVGLTVLGKL